MDDKTLKQINKALKIAVNLCPKDNAGYKDILIAKDMVEKELASGLSAIPGVTKVKDFGSAIFEEVARQFRARAQEQKQAASPCSMYAKFKKMCTEAWPGNQVVWCKFCRATYGKG